VCLAALLAHADEKDAPAKQPGAVGKEQAKQATTPEQAPRLLRASELIDKSVMNEQGEDLGDIEDIVADSQGGRIAYFVLHFDPGFLDYGGKLFAVPYQALKEDTARKNMLLNVPKAKFERSRGFDKDNWPNMADEKWAQDIHKHYGFDGESESRGQIERRDDGAEQPGARLNQPQPDRADQRATDVQRSPSDADRPNDRARVADAGAATNRVSTLLGMKVIGTGDKDLGSLKDIIIDMRDGRLAYGVVTDGGVVGVGVRETLSAVPWGMLSINTVDEQVRIAASEAQLKKYSFKEASWPNMADEHWATALHEHFGAEPYWSVLGTPRTDATDAAWRADGKYARLYQANREKTIEGEVQEVGRFTIEGSQAAGTQLVIVTKDDEKVAVHLGPQSFMADQKLQVKTGDQIKIIGSQAEHGGRQIVLAREVHKGDQMIRVRNEQGAPLWQTRPSRPAQPAQPDATPRPQR
jgi:sporulation protein YlmC with PRC-barrel domain